MTISQTYKSKNHKMFNMYTNQQTCCILSNPFCKPKLQEREKFINNINKY